MNTEMINLQRLRELIDAYGGEPRRWPESERAAALALLEDSSEARAWLGQARATDIELDRLTVPPPSPALRDALLERAPRPRGWRPALASLWRDLGGWSLAGPALAAGLALGLGMGIGLSPLPATNGFDDEALFRLAGLDAGTDADDLWSDAP